MSNRILIEAGDARNCRAWRVGFCRATARSRARENHLTALGREGGPTRERGRRRSIFVGRSPQFPFDWKRTLASRLAPGYGGHAVYLNTAARRARGSRRCKRSADRRRPRSAAAALSPRHVTPSRTSRALFPRVIDTASTYQVDPAREGYPDLIALPERVTWVRTKFTPGTNVGRGRRRASPGRTAPRGSWLWLGRRGHPGPESFKADPPATFSRARRALRFVDLAADPRRGGGGALDVLSFRGSTFLREDRPSPIVGRTGFPEVDFDYTPEEQAIIEQRISRTCGYLE